MLNNPEITIVTPSFNQGRFIERTLASVAQQQTDFPVEHIVVDGGSTDDTLAILERYSRQIRFISEPDRGMPDAVNKGIALSHGAIIGWLNSDDIYLPGCLSKVSDFFRSHPGCHWLFGHCRMIGEDDREVRRWITAYKNRSASRYSRERLYVENFISQPAVFFRRSAFEKAGCLDISLPTAMDYDLWLRLAAMGDPGYIGEDLACFRVHGSSISARSYKAQFDEQYSIHRRYDNHRGRLFRHRLKNLLIVGVYSVLEKARLLSGKRDQLF